LDSTGFPKFLIIKPSSLGDVIHALPVAAALKAEFPGACVDWLVGRGYEEVLEGNPAVDRVIIFDRRMFDGPGKLGRLKRLISELRLERYDAVLDLQGLLRSGLMTFACRTGAMVGFATAREGAALFYTDRVAVPDADMHAVDRYLLTLKPLGAKCAWGRGGTAPIFSLAIGEPGHRQADEVLRDAGIEDGEPFVAIAPSARWVTKRWPAENFVGLVNMLKARRGIKSVLIGSAGEATALDGHKDKLVSLKTMAFGKTSIMGLAALLSRARLLVTNDSGPMHLAAAVGTPTIAIFGPTDARRTGPYGHGHLVITSGERCAPCFRRECDTVSCLTRISVEEVYERLQPLVFACGAT